MVSSSSSETLIYNVKLSSVGPATVTGTDVVHELSNMDLVMKLHYLRGIYFFEKEAVEGLTISKIKESMFYWLDEYYITCGRVRRFETGAPPFIRCNDCGVRLIEAKCNMNMDEFLELKDCCLQNKLFYNQVIGPELTFSPLVMIQLTSFECGGMSVGLRWSHVLGDAFSATEYINIWAQVLAGHHQPYKSLSPPINQAQMKSQAQISSPLPAKQVNSVGDYWITPNNCKMDTFFIEIPATELQSDLSGRISYFVSISAVIWQCLGKIRQESNPNTVTICRSYGNGYLGNNPILNVVKAGFEVGESDPMDLADLIMDQNMNVTNRVGQEVGKDEVVADYVMYGANPTFVDLEGVNLYGLELNGLKPVFANYMIHGVGDAGVIIVLPNADGGRTVTITVPENEVLPLKSEMGKKWNIS